MKKFNVVNYHITNRCNYHCSYCFGKFNGQADPSLDEAKMVIDKICKYFIENNIEGRINLAGGEPLLYKHLDELIDYIYSCGISVSIVTNASLLTTEQINAWAGKVCCIGISIDSLLRDTNLKIGRHCNKNTLSLFRLIELSNDIRKCHMDLKINTVVSQLNLKEDLSTLYKALNPHKIKLFQMHLIDGINDCAKSYEITENDFLQFCDKHKEFKSIMVLEPCGSMENSYLMVNPNGELQINDKGTYRTFGNLNSSPLDELLKKAPLDSEKFNSRYTNEEFI